MLSISSGRTVCQATARGPAGTARARLARVASVGVVLGAGGEVGHAYHAGVLAALADVGGWDAREADLVVGTSAGALTGALLRAGLPPRDLLARVVDAPLSEEGRAVIARSSAVRRPDLRASGRPRLPRPAAPGMLPLLARRPFSVRPGVVTAALVPEGTVSTEAVAAPLRALWGGTWPTRAFQTCAVSLVDGRRVVFGSPHGSSSRSRDIAPAVDVATAVAASCAIPGFFVPVTVDGQRYVDGGVHSVTNADLAARDDLEAVIVSAPMSMAASPWPPTPDAAIRWPRRRRLARELATLRARGASVLVVQPTLADRKAMGFVTMDAGRRARVARRSYRSARALLADPDAAGFLARLSA